MQVDKDEPLGKSDYSPISSGAIGGGAQHPFVKNHVNDTEFDIARDPRFAAAFQLRPWWELPLHRGFILFGGVEAAEAAAGGGAAPWCPTSGVEAAASEVPPMI